MSSILDQSYDLVSVDDLKPHPDNPRRGDADAIAKSVAANGFYGTIVAQRSTGHVLAGNHRLLAARQEGLTHVPVAWIDVDDERARRILVVDNRANDLAVYDEAQLLDLLSGLALSADALIGTGFTAEELVHLSERLHDPSLDDLADRHTGGDSDDEDADAKKLWPVIRVQVPPDVHVRWQALLDRGKASGGDAVSALAYLLDAVDA